MNDDQCVEFLRWLLPRLHLRWPGYRRVRRQVCKRIGRRLTELGIDDVAAYRDYLLRNPAELSVADQICRITISRFNRDRGVFDYLATNVLPELGRMALRRGDTRLLAWSAGCASGEEPYTLAIVWQLLVARRLADLDLRILGTDVDETLLRRARLACYSRSSLKELPGDWLANAFDETPAGYRLDPDISARVSFRRHDVRDGPVDGEFDLVLCRNLAFTYFDEEMQGAAARVLCRGLREGGALVLGAHETLPAELAEFGEWSAANSVYRKRVPDSGANVSRRNRLRLG